MEEAVKTSRSALARLLEAVPEKVRTSGADAAVEAVCAALELIPVPIVGKALSGAVRSLLKRGEPADDVLHQLAAMARSDAEFAEGLARLTGSLDEIAADVALIRTAVVDGQSASLDYMDGRFDEQWPVFDNQISGILTNRGGGSVAVQEIRLVVERWEPNTTVDLSIPGAPLPELRLKVTLTNDQDDYRLLALNGASQRLLNERGAGAERVVIDMHSDQNADFWVRLHFDYTDLSTGGQGSLSWPPAGTEAVRVPFAFAPGWNRYEFDELINIESLTSAFLDAYEKSVQAVAAATAQRDFREQRMAGDSNYGRADRFLSCVATFSGRAHSVRALRIYLEAVCTLTEAAKGSLEEQTREYFRAKRAERSSKRPDDEEILWRPELKDPRKGFSPLVSPQQAADDLRELTGHTPYQEEVDQVCPLLFRPPWSTAAARKLLPSIRSS
jgi:hypothetical protein